MVDRHSEATSAQQLSAISQQLDRLLRISALLLVQNSERLADKVDALHRSGLPPKFIAELLGTTANTVSVQLSRRRARAREDSRLPRQREKDSERESGL